MSKDLKPFKDIESYFTGRGFEVPVEPLPELWTAKTELRGLVRGYNDVQQVRIMMGNRIVGDQYRRFGLKPGEKKGNLKGLPDDLMREIVKEYRRVTDGIVVNMREIPKIMRSVHPGIIASEVMFIFVDVYLGFARKEYLLKKELERELENFPIWTDYLKNIVGVGETLGGIIVSELDPYKAEHPTAFWSYAGLDVVWITEQIEGEEIVIGEGRSKKDRHLVMRKYKDKSGNEREKKSITFSPFLKTKLHVLATSFLRKQEDVYSPIFYNYRVRMQGRREYFTRALRQGNILYKKDPHDSEGFLTLNSKKYNLCKKWISNQKKVPTLPQTKKFVLSNIISDNHIKNMCIRYMLKIFLLNLWTEWRRIEGLPVTAPYHEEKLGIVHSG